ATPEVKKAINRLLDNLKDGAPLNLLSQFMPIQYARVRDGSLKNDPKELILNRIGDAIDDYLYATRQRELLR
ncbi:MAG: class II D-tagatose-bisphosphate aldolase, non-catalytic subunit, partial [Erysipelotrichaceae bacterium]|nr:class II D-tagatose-bisphosphate aldolase, non-catalytic subunit [Erysipelotrichaceae bacterium]